MIVFVPFFFICVIETFVIHVRHNLEPTIVLFVIYGCQTTNLPTIVVIVDFVESVDEKTFVIVTIVACASIRYYLTITIAKPESI